MKRDLTEIWRSVYSYKAVLEPVDFVANLVATDDSFDGVCHETIVDFHGVPVTLYASIAGLSLGSRVDFTKIYNPGCQWKHAIDYSGVLSADGNRISGQWWIPDACAGQFAMQRSHPRSELIGGHSTETF